MSNPIFDALNKPGGRQSGPMNMIQAFQQFMQQNQGKNPNEMIQQLLSSGQINPRQLEQAQKMARQMAGPLNGIKSMFGF